MAYNTQTLILARWGPISVVNLTYSKGAQKEITKKYGSIMKYPLVILCLTKKFVNQMVCGSYIKYEANRP